MKFSKKIIGLAILLGTISSSIYSLSKSQELLEAAKAGDLEKVKALVPKAFYERWPHKPRPRQIINMPDKWGNTPLMLAISEGHCDVAMYLLDKAAFVEIQNRYGETALSIAEEKKEECPQVKERLDQITTRIEKTKKDIETVRKQSEKQRREAEEKAMKRYREELKPWKQRRKPSGERRKLTKEERKKIAKIRQQEMKRFKEKIQTNQ